MTTNASTALKAEATGGAVAKADKPKTIAGLLTDPAVKQQLALAASARGMTPAQAARAAAQNIAGLQADANAKAAELRVRPGSPADGRTAR